MNSEGMAKMFEYCRDWKPRKLDEKFEFKKPLHRGWLLPYLTQLDLLSWERWEHWFKTMEAGKMLDETIPQIRWSDGVRANPARKMFEKSLDSITRHGSWQGWSSYQYFDFFMDWLLFGFGHESVLTEPEEPSGCEGASKRLYQTFDLTPWLAYPNDYFGDILAENNHGRSQGFFPTPMHVCQMMVEMQMSGEDMRDKTVCDPALGTGRMLLAASNFSYRLFGNDISLTVIKATLVNGYVLAPWMVKPFPFFNGKGISDAADNIVEPIAIESSITPETPLIGSGKTSQLTLL